MQNCEKAKSQWKRRYVSKVMLFRCFCYTVLLTNLKIGLSLSKSLFEVVKEPKWAPQRASLTTSLRHFHFVISPLWENHTKKPPFLHIYAETGADVFYSLMNRFVSLLNGTFLLLKRFLLLFWMEPFLLWTDFCFSFGWNRSSYEPIFVSLLNEIYTIRSLRLCWAWGNRCEKSRTRRGRC